MGAINGLEPAIVSEMFGLKNMGKNYMLLWVGQFGTVVLLSQWLSAKVYEANITGGGKVCMGDKCFGLVSSQAICWVLVMSPFLRGCL